MAVYAYKAMDGGAAGLVKGTITADSPRQARDTLRARGLRVQDLAEVRGRRARAEDAVAGGGVASERGRGSARTSWYGRRSEAKVLAFCRELSTLLAAGIPLLQSLDAIIRQNRGRFQASLMLLRDKIAAGEGLAEAMREQPELFDALSINMVEVGERSGTLDYVLEQLASFKQRSQQFKGRLATALIYPAIVVTAGVGVTLFLMSFVVPKLLETLVEVGTPLPLPTRIVKTGSDVLVGYWWLILPLVVASVVGLTALMRVPKVRYAWHGLVLRLPIIGDLIRKQAVVRMSVALATLTRSGVEFVTAVGIVQESIGNLVIRDALQRCREAVLAGRDIAPALEATGAFPPTVVQIVDVGQATGKLDQMLERLAVDYDAQVQIAAQRMLAVFEPVLILLLAGFILFIVLSVILPYLEVGNVL